MFLLCVRCDVESALTSSVVKTTVRRLRHRRRAGGSVGAIQMSRLCSGSGQSLRVKSRFAAA